MSENFGMGGHRVTNEAWGSLSVRAEKDLTLRGFKHTARTRPSGGLYNVQQLFNPGAEARQQLSDWNSSSLITVCVQ